MIKIYTADLTDVKISNKFINQSKSNLKDGFYVLYAGMAIPSATLAAFGFINFIAGETLTGITSLGLGTVSLYKSLYNYANINDEKHSFRPEVLQYFINRTEGLESMQVKKVLLLEGYNQDITTTYFVTPKKQLKALMETNKVVEHEKYGEKLITEQLFLLDDPNEVLAAIEISDNHVVKKLGTKYFN